MIRLTSGRYFLRARKIIALDWLEIFIIQLSFASYSAARIRINQVKVDQYFRPRTRE